MNMCVKMKPNSVLFAFGGAFKRAEGRPFRAGWWGRTYIMGEGGREGATRLVACLQSFDHCSRIPCEMG